MERDVMYSRRVVMTGAGVAAGAVLLGQNAWGQAEIARKERAEEMQVNAPEELMRQHAVAGRLLLIYDNAASPELGAARPSAKALVATAQMIRSNVDEHHMKLEEEIIFPLFQKGGAMTDLITVLREQHTAARRLNDAILRAAERSESTTTESLARDLRAYTRMLAAHTAYEETVLYPQLRTVSSPEEYEGMERTLQEADRKKVGPQGFAGLVARVAELESTAGITGLAQFTARVGGERTAMGAATR
jgi:hemerythrin-like domain-containing protein